MPDNTGGLMDLFRLMERHSDWSREGYPSELDEDEVVYGFYTGLYPNPETYAGEPPRISMAVSQLDPDLVAVKTGNPEAGISYAVWGIQESGAPRRGARGDSADTLHELIRRFPTPLSQPVEFRSEENIFTIALRRLEVRADADFYAFGYAVDHERWGVRLFKLLVRKEIEPSPAEAWEFARVRGKEELHSLLSMSKDGQTPLLWPDLSRGWMLI